MIYKYGWESPLCMCLIAHMQVIMLLYIQTLYFAIEYTTGQVIESFKLFIRERESEFFLEVLIFCVKLIISKIF